MNKIVLAGGSGYLGNLLAEYFSAKAEKIVIISRSGIPSRKNITHAPWNGKDEGVWMQELEGADVLINIAGKNVNCRYTPANKEEILQSRLASTSILGAAVLKCMNPPKVWINASSATIYEASYNQKMTEQTGVIGDDFSMTVCREWEATFNQCKTTNTRKIIARIGIVLGKGGGALPMLTVLTRLRFGGQQGTGKQFVSWIHENDFCRSVEWLFSNKDAEGVYNLVAPASIPNAEFMDNLRHSMGIGWGISLPRKLLEIGAVVIRTETELVLKSRKVYPERLLNEGFVFEFTDVKEALDDLCSVETKRN